MNIEEYNKIKKLTYFEYCDYLQNKYGLPPRPYCSKKGVRYRENSATAYGLFIHHKMEFLKPALCDISDKNDDPNLYEWQKRKYLIYCDYLEHLLLHILAVECPTNNEHNGGGGIGLIYEEIICCFAINTKIDYTLIDESHFWYYLSNNKSIPTALTSWRQTCFNAIKGDFDVFVELLNRFAHYKPINERSFYGDIVRLQKSKEFMYIISTYESTYLSRENFKSENLIKYEKWKKIDEDGQYLNAEYKYLHKKYIQQGNKVATIITYRNYNDVDVQFEDNYIINHVRMDKINEGRLIHPDIKKAKNKTKEIKTKRNFEEKVVKEKVQRTRNFIQEDMKKKYVGMTVKLNCGVNATCIDYINSKNITIQFEDGTIREHIRMDKFKMGKVKYIKSTIEK